MKNSLSNLFRWAVVFILALQLPLQQVISQEVDIQKNIEKLKQIARDSSLVSSYVSDAKEEGDAMVQPQAPCNCDLDTATYKAYLLSLQRYYEYRVHGFDHRQKIFEWQYLSSKIIFVVVIILVLAGIYFAAVQFHHGLKWKKKAPGEDEATELVLSYKSVSVKSPVLGVIILVLSLAFFYLYLVYVYPIENIF
jgi:hypothetical protein